MVIKIRQFYKDIVYFYKIYPNNSITGILTVAKVLYWHIILKRVRKLFIGNYLDFKIIYDTSSDGCAYAYFLPYLEYSFYEFISYWVKKEDTIFDIGSNIGYYPLICASKGAIVHSFEPNGDIRKLQEINILLNNFEDSVIINPQAVSEKNGKSSFYLQSKGQSGVSSLNYNVNDAGEKISVDTINLDTYIKNNNIKCINLLKVDVEGSELNVFKGGDKALRDSIIKTIYWESNSIYPLEERMQSIKILTKYGYEHFAIDEKVGAIRKWEAGDSNCFSIHKSVKKDFKFYMNSKNLKDKKK